MKALVSHNTALTYWRQHFPLDSELGKSTDFNTAEAYAYQKKDVLACIPEYYLDPDMPVDVLVLDSSLRRHSGNIRCHIWGGKVPSTAFFRIGEMYVSSPEFVFMQMASELPLIQLIALGCELCGMYVLLPQGVKHPSALDDCPTRISPLTNIGKLSAFLDEAGQFKNVAKARRALRYLVEGARSPMETMTYLLLCLPPKIGGYGLPSPELNATIKLDDEAQRIARRRHCMGDLCWPDCKLDIEYHGEVHTGVANMRSDVGRTLGIEHMGWQVITVTSPQVFDIDEFEVVAKSAAKRIGRKLSSRILGQTPARWELRDELRHWMFSK